FIRVWRIDGMLLQTIESHQAMTTCLAFTPDGQHVLAGSEFYNHTLRMWRVADGVQVAIIDDQNGAGADSLFFTSDGRRVLLARLDGVVGAIHNPVLPPCPADTDADGVVGLGDLALLLSHFGDIGQSPATGDVDDDGDVDLSDLAEMLGDFGT